MKETPLKDLCYMGGWKYAMTVLTCYQQHDRETQKEALGSDSASGLPRAAEPP